MDEEKIKNNYPNGYKYLLSKKEELILRDLRGSTKWYEYGRNQGLKFMNNEKIVISTIFKNKIVGNVVDKDTLVYSGLFLTKKMDCDWNILNKLFEYEFFEYVNLMGKHFSGGYKTLNSNHIKNYIL
jgi:adenine-specific DNA-methyltransferase